MRSFKAQLWKGLQATSQHLPYSLTSEDRAPAEPIRFLHQVLKKSGYQRN